MTKKNEKKDDVNENKLYNPGAAYYEDQHTSIHHKKSVEQEKQVRD